MTSSSEPLFRPRAVEYASNKLHGDVLVTPKISHSIISAGFMLWLALIIYFLHAFEWTTTEKVYGIVDENSPTPSPSVTLYLSAHSHPYLQTGQVLPASIDGIPDRQNVSIRIESISDHLTDDCNICPNESPGRQFYLKARGTLQNNDTALHGTHLSLQPGTRVHLELPTEKQSLIDWLNLGDELQP